MFIKTVLRQEEIIILAMAFMHFKGFSEENFFLKKKKHLHINSLNIDMTGHYVVVTYFGLTF